MKLKEKKQKKSFNQKKKKLERIYLFFFFKGEDMNSKVGGNRNFFLV